MSLIYGAATVAVVVIATVLSALFWDEAIRDGLLGSFLANALARVVGMPIALHANRLHQAHSDTAERERRKREDQSHRQRVLLHLQRELQFNATLLRSRRRVISKAAEGTGGPRGIVASAPARRITGRRLAPVGKSATSRMSSSPT